MRFWCWVPGFMLAVLLVIPVNTLAVGYERYHPNGRPIVQHNEKKQVEPPVWESLKKATCLDRLPAFLDGTAKFVRDILGQFGLTGQNAP